MAAVGEYYRNLKNINTVRLYFEIIYEGETYL